jgi:hypothetical protein
LSDLVVVRRRRLPALTELTEDGACRRASTAAVPAPEELHEQEDDECA